MSGALQRAPVVSISMQRTPPLKKPSNGYPPFHHGSQLTSSAVVNHWSRPLAMPTQLSVIQLQAAAAVLAML